MPVVDAKGGHAMSQGLPATGTKSTSTMMLMAALWSGGNGAAELATIKDAPTTAKDERRLTNSINTGQGAGSNAIINEVACQGPACKINQ